MLPVEASEVDCGNSLRATNIQQDDIPSRWIDTPGAGDYPWSAGHRWSPLAENVVAECNQTKSLRRVGGGGLFLVGSVLMVGGGLALAGRNHIRV